MKTIFITLKEFLNNGGKLKGDTKIYRLESSITTSEIEVKSMSYIGNFVAYHETLPITSMPEFFYYCDEAGNQIFVSIYGTFVKIKVTPIYIPL